MAIDVEKYNNLRNQCKEIQIFVYDGLLIKGYPSHVITDYLNENPSKKFRTWLIDNDLLIREL